MVVDKKVERRVNMLNMECAEKFCKDCLSKIPEKDRELIMKKLETCFQSHFNCNTKKEK
jgi:hypothetical protein